MAVDYALTWGLDNIEARVGQLATHLRQRLGAIPSVDLHDRGRRQCGIVTFTVAGFSAAEVQRRLARDGVNVSVSRAEQAQLDLPLRGLSELVRASVHYYNTENEIDRLADVLMRTD